MSRNSGAVLVGIGLSAALGIAVPARALPICDNGAIRKGSESTKGYARCKCTVCANCAWEGQVSYVGKCTGGTNKSTCAPDGSQGIACRNYREVLNKWKNCSVAPTPCYTQRCVMYTITFQCSEMGPAPPAAPGACNPCTTSCAHCCDARPGEPLLPDCCPL